MTTNRRTFSLSRTTFAVVTGGSSGIGEQVIRQLLSLSADIVVCNLSRSRPEAFLKEHRVCHISCDLGKGDSVPNAVEEIRKILEGSGLKGQVLLVNNSGFGSYGEFASQDPASEENMVRVNCAAPVRLTAELLPLLRERGGAVVNLSSVAAFQPTPFMSTYGATKAFNLYWSLGLGEELRREGIGCLAVCPGPTATRFFSRAGFAEPPGAVKGHTAERVVRATFKALERGDAMVVVGARNSVMAWFAGRLPRVWVARIAAVVLRKMRLERYLKK